MCLVGTGGSAPAAHSHRHNKRHVFRCSMSSEGPLAHRATHTVDTGQHRAEALTMIAITNQYHSQNFDIRNGIVSAGWKFQVPSHKGKHSADSSKHFSKNLSFSHESIFKLEDELHIQVKLNSLNCYLVSIVHKNFTINICKYTHHCNLEQVAVIQKGHLILNTPFIAGQCKETSELWQKFACQLQQQSSFLNTPGIDVSSSKKEVV